MNCMRQNKNNGIFYGLKTVRVFNRRYKRIALSRGSFLRLLFKTKTKRLQNGNLNGSAVREARLDLKLTKISA